MGSRNPLRLPWHQELFRWLVRQIFRLFYRIRVTGQENVPETGGVLLVCNHQSWLDGILVMMLTRRPVRPVVYAGNFRAGWLAWWARKWGTIFLESGPKAMVRALREANQALRDGHVICLFPEGGITRTGQLNPFRPGVKKILEGTGCPVVPILLDELWGSVFSFSEGKFFWKWPQQWRYPVSVHYGQPIWDTQEASELRQKVAVMSATLVHQRQRPFMSLTRSFLRACKRRLFRSKVADSSDADHTGGDLLMRTLILRRLLLRQVLAPREEYVGVLLPPSAGAVIVNMALALARRVPVHLNYTTTSQILNQCLQRAGISHVLTSRRVLSKLDLKLDAPLVCLEDFKDQVHWTDKAWGVLGAFLLPTPILARCLGLHKQSGRDTATVIFTSGSTGVPKGVVLSYDNVASNVEAINAAVRLTPRDVVLGILPFFHSFGYTVTMWTPMALNLKAVYHFSPLDARRVGNLVEKHGATVLLATPTFLRGYVKRCTPEQFKTLEVVVAGAEKLPKALCDAFEERFGVRPVEGYGCTELSPLVSVNIPPARSAGTFFVERKEGSVGRPVAHVAARVTHPDSDQELPIGQEGMLWITGPNVMQGYLNQPDLTRQVIRDGWYRTGDIARLDEDGFIFITGRQSRFSKIGGEMIPHVQVEEAIMQVLGIDDDQGVQLAVSSVPDEKKGERLIVLHRKLSLTPEEICAALAQLGLPNLYIPSPDSFIEVPEIPVLGTGKLDLCAVQKMAQQKAASVVEGSYDCRE